MDPESCSVALNVKVEKDSAPLFSEAMVYVPSSSSLVSPMYHVMSGCGLPNAEQLKTASLPLITTRSAGLNVMLAPTAKEEKAHVLEVWSYKYCINDLRSSSRTTSSAEASWMTPIRFSTSLNTVQV